MANGDDPGAKPAFERVNAEGRDRVAVPIVTSPHVPLSLSFWAVWPEPADGSSLAQGVPSLDCNRP
jgi:hypothetical protein